MLKICRNKRTLVAADLCYILAIFCRDRAVFCRDIVHMLIFILLSYDKVRIVAIKFLCHLA